MNPIRTRRTRRAARRRIAHINAVAKIMLQDALAFGEADALAKATRIVDGGGRGMGRFPLSGCTLTRAGMEPTQENLRSVRKGRVTP